MTSGYANAYANTNTLLPSPFFEILLKIIGLFEAKKI